MMSVMMVAEMIVVEEVMSVVGDREVMAEVMAVMVRFWEATSVMMTVVTHGEGGDGSGGDDGGGGDDVGGGRRR